MKIYAHIIIRRPISDVFNYLADVRNDVHWRDEVILGELISEGPLGVGSEGRNKVKQYNRELEITWRCTRFEPHEYIEWEWISGPFPANAGYKLKSIDGGTDFTLHGTAKLKGITRLISPIIQIFSNRQLQKSAKTLQRILESKI